MYLVLSVLQCYLMSQGYSQSALQGFSVFWALYGGWMVVAPRTALQVLCRADPSILNEASVLMVTFHGYAVLSMSACLLSILHWNATRVQGIGYFNVVWLLRGIYKNCKQFHRTEFSWLVLHAAIAYLALRS